MMGLWSVIGTFSKYSYHFTSNKCAALTKPGNGTYSPGNHTGIPIVPCWYNLKLTTKKNGSGQIFWHHKRYLSMLSIDTHRKEENSIKHLRLYHSTSVDDIPMVSASTMKKSLRSFRISFYDGFTCLIADCVLCSDCITSPTQTKLYINKTTGYFICQQCCSSGSWTELEKHLSKKKSSKPVDPKELDKIKEGLVEEANIAAEWKQIRKLTSPLTSLPEQDINVILKDLQLSLVSPVIGRFEPRINDTRSLLYFPLCSCDGQVAGYKVLHRETCLETTIPLTGCSGIVVAKQGKASRHEAVLVSSVSDALSLATQKMPYQIVCLPHGLTSLPQQVLPTLERFRKLILWFGNDVKSWDIARNFAKKLDEKRCYFVRPIESQPSPQAALALGQDLRAIVAAAQPIWHEAITEFSSLREDVLAELQNNDKINWISEQSSKLY